MGSCKIDCKSITKLIPNLKHQIGIITPDKTLNPFNEEDKDSTPVSSKHFAQIVQMPGTELEESQMEGVVGSTTYMITVRFNDYTKSIKHSQRLQLYSPFNCIVEVASPIVFRNGERKFIDIIAAEYIRE